MLSHQMNFVMEFDAACGAGGSDTCSKLADSQDTPDSMASTRCGTACSMADSLTVSLRSSCNSSEGVVEAKEAIANDTQDVEEVLFSCAEDVCWPTKKPIQVSNARRLPSMASLMRASTQTPTVLTDHIGDSHKDCIREIRRFARSRPSDVVSDDNIWQSLPILDSAGGRMELTKAAMQQGTTTRECSSLAGAAAQSLLKMRRVSTDDGSVKSIDISSSSSVFLSPVAPAAPKPVQRAPAPHRARVVRVA